MLLHCYHHNIRSYLLAELSPCAHRRIVENPAMDATYKDSMQACCLMLLVDGASRPVRRRRLGAQSLVFYSAARLPIPYILGRPEALLVGRAVRPNEVTPVVLWVLDLTGSISKTAKTSS